MYIAILGRQHKLALAELERVYGEANLLSSQAALVNHSIDITRLGGSLKAGRIILRLGHADWKRIHTSLLSHFSKEWQDVDHKITLGISTYGLPVSPRDIQRTGLALKKQLKQHNTSLRLIPNNDPALNTATSHHNKLGLSPNKIELLIVRADDGSVIVAESTGAQNITALARRDQGRPKRDAFVGMLPPKLAQIIVNLAVGNYASSNTPLTILDPFCGTGVLLQESMLLGYTAYGTDLADKMINFSAVNLTWAQEKLHADVDFRLAQADAMTATWQPPINVVACETYLGQPFSAPPSTNKLREVRGNCEHIIGTFLKNISSQITHGTPLCIAVPAWRASDGSFTHLPLVHNTEQFGLRKLPLKSVRASDLLYYREDQVVARELLLLEKI